MNRKTKTVYVCSNCGQDYAKWLGKCQNCGQWDSISEFRQAKTGKSSPLRLPDGNQPALVTLSSCKPDTLIRIHSGFADVDRVLGGGLVPGSMILVGGNPGIGKSTLVLQSAASCAKKGLSVLYVSGEESAEQLSLRARRLGIADVSMNLLTEVSVQRICAHLDAVKPALVIIDSIQTIFSEELESAPGSVGQVRESAAILLRFAKETRTAVILVGHVTKEGAIAGPRVLEHMVDTVLYFEGDSSYQYRILRTVKNRFGASGEIAVLTMSDSGLAEVSNASEFFLLHREVPQIGTSIVPVLEGTRILVVELQALVNPTHFGLPQRVASGINPKKLSLLLAVLERYAGISLGSHDIFFNITGGLAISEPAIDCGIAAAVLSSFLNKPVRNGVAFIGEVGLGGELRPVNNMSGRLKELAGLGFTSCVVPPAKKGSDWTVSKQGMQQITCRSVNDIGDYIF